MLDRKASTPKLQSSNNYSQFVPSEFNRDLHKLNELRQSMKEHGYLPAYPLHVRVSNGKLVVVGGHHRFEVARQLGIAVYYVVCEDTASIAQLERATKPWKFRDFVNSFARAGSLPHLAIVEFSERTGIGLEQSSSLLAGECASSMNQRDRVKAGTFICKPNEHCEAVGSLILAIRGLGIKFATAENFVAAISSICWLPEFDRVKFLHRASNVPHMFVKQATKVQYMELIEKIYNFGAKDRCALAFLAKEAARARSAVQKRRKQDGDGAV